MAETNPKTEDQKPKTYLRFRADEKSPFVEIHQGEYRRRFEADKQPFAIDDPAEVAMLRESGHFVEDKAAEQESRELDVVVPTETEEAMGIGKAKKKERG